MTERKWTKGPWTIEATTLHAYITPPKGHYVASVILPADTFHMSRPEKRKRSEMANAHLIAASPEMYEALEALVDLQNGPPLIREQVEWNSAMDRARAALAKARGET